jgi:hypothetical protein
MLMALINLWWNNSSKDDNKMSEEDAVKIIEKVYIDYKNNKRKSIILKKNLNLQIKNFKLFILNNNTKCQYNNKSKSRKKNVNYI